MNGKKKMTRAQARARYAYIFSAGANDLDFCGVNERGAVGYNCGVYGWNWDLIPIASDIAICQGYRATVGAPIPRIFRERIFTAKRAWIAAYNDYSAPDRSERMAAAKHEGKSALADLIKSINKEG